MTDSPTITNLREIEIGGRMYWRFDWDAPYKSLAWQSALDGVKCVPLDEREWDPVAKHWTVLVTPDNAVQLSMVFPNFWKAVEAIHAQGVLAL